MANVPITYGSGQASIAGDTVGSTTYQQIKVIDGTIGGTTGLIVNADGTANVRISGSVATAGGTFTGSVSGTVGASIIGIVPATIVTNTGSFGTDSNNLVGWNTPGATVVSPTPVAGWVFNGNNWDRAKGNSVIGTLVSTGASSVITVGQGSVGVVIIGGSIAASFTPPANQSVSGTVGASVIGWVPVQTSNTSVITVSQSSSIIGVVTGSVVAIPTGNQSVSGALFVSGSVLLGNSNASVISYIQNSVATVIIGGSIAASFTPPANQSVSGTVNIGTGGPVSVMGTMSVLGTVPVTQVTSPWIITGSVQGSFSPSGNQSVSGTVGASIIGQLPAGTAPLGSVTTLQGTNPWVVVNVGSVISINTGSIITTQIGSVITVWKDSSVLAVPVGSTIGIWQNASIAGTYAEDAATATGDRGLFILFPRNDTMSSITSADLDYSGSTVGPVGEMLVANAPITKWVQGTADLRGAATLGASAIAIAAGGSSVFTYITGVQVANMGSASVLVTFASGGSTLGYTIAPAGGGSNIVYPNALKTPANFGFAASLSGVASVLVSAQGFISKT